MFAKYMYRVKLEQIILFVKVVNRYFKTKECFPAAPVPKFWWQFHKNQGCENFCSRYSNKCLRLASENFVLDSVSNLSLATGLAS